ncbi:hypothetical protein [Microbacterium sp. 16-032]|uniref:hypothetical protein n=1 Tax=Microbacterium sp. 16-032 TaxID=3239808 RepID=UPI0034E1E1B3
MSDDNYDDDLYDDLATDTTPTGPWTPGEKVTVLCGGMSINTGIPIVTPSYVYKRSDVFTVTADTITYQSWLLDLAADQDEQIRRWGEVRLLRGTHDVTPWLKVGDPVWQVMHDDARRIALAHVDPEDRQRAMEQVREKFGKQPQTPSISFEYTDLAQQRRLAEDAALRKAHGRHTYASS